jgi:hypothetical protein
MEGRTGRKEETEGREVGREGGAGGERSEERKEGREGGEERKEDTRRKEGRKVSVLAKIDSPWW